MNAYLMKILKFTSLLLFIMLIQGCASRYKKIEPEKINYIAFNPFEKITLDYKYDLLSNKYKKKETRNHIKLVAVKITNKSNKDLIFGKNIKIVSTDNRDIDIVDNETIFKTLRQRPASYLWYLLFAPLNVYEGDKMIPIGLAIVPGAAGGNLLVANSANQKFKKELIKYNITGLTIKKGETLYGLIGINSESYESLKLKIE